MYFLKGGNWQDGMHAGLWSFTDPRATREIVPLGILDVDGLPGKVGENIERWKWMDLKEYF